MATLAVQRLTGPEIAFRDGNGIATKSGSLAGRLAPEADARHRDSKLEADQVIRLVHCRVRAGIIRHQAVLLEKPAHVVARRRQRHVYAPPEVAHHGPPIAFKARGDFDLPAVVAPSSPPSPSP